MNNVIVRALSGAVYVALIVVCTMAGGWCFFGLTVLFAAIGLNEYQNLSAEREHARQPWTIRAIDMTTALLMLCMAATIAATVNRTGIFYPGKVLTVALCGFMLLTACLSVRLCLSLGRQHGDAVSSCASSLMGTLYIALPLSMLCAAGMLTPEVSGSCSTGGCPFAGSGVFRNAILTMFILIWLNDTGAFCTGVLFGKHRLCERLSPKKSWEGFWGGFVCCLIAGALLAGWAGMPAWWTGALYGACVSVLATWGDLFESQLKRTAGVKDSGSIIPGHGGVLDRIDSLLFVAPAAVIFMILATFL